MPTSLSLSQLKTQGRYQEATALALRQLAAEPEAAMLHFQLACLYDVQGLEQQAIPCYLAALARDLPPAQRREAGWASAAPTAPGRIPGFATGFRRRPDRVPAGQRADAVSRHDAVQPGRK